MNKFCFIALFLLLISFNPLLADTNETIINLNVQVNPDYSFDDVSGDIIYESKNEINKRRIYFLIPAAFSLLLVILILKKKF